MSTLAFDPHTHTGAHDAAARGGPVQLAVGLAALTVDRLGVGNSQRAAVLVGLMAKAKDAAGRMAAPPMRVVNRAGQRVTQWPVVGPRMLAGNERMTAMLVDARLRGGQILSTDSNQAVRFVRRNVDDLFAQVVPRVVEGVLPEIRARVMPALIEDLSNDPRVRGMLMEQSRGAITEATRSLHATAARADDRVESAAQRLLGRNGGREPAPNDDSPG